MEYLTLQDIPSRHFYNPRRMASPDAPRSETQLPGMTHNRHMRNSPPFQPGEQRPSNTLPSFSQLMQNVREPSPPRTPSRKNGSMENSPVARTHFDDVAWESEGKRRRTEAASSNVPIHSGHSVYDSRRASTVDPTVRPQQAAYPGHQHRPSLSYTTQPPAATTGSHARHHSASVLHAPQPGAFPYPHGHSSGPAPPAHYVAPQHHTATYERRGSYYPETHYERHESYYPAPQPYMPAPPQGYDVGYHAQAPPHSFTFHSSYGLDQNSFGNRKRRGNLPKEATAILKAWYANHQHSPYPTEDEKNELCRQTMLSLNQVSNWFINARRRAPGKEQREAAAAQARPPQARQPPPSPPPPE